MAGHISRSFSTATIGSASAGNSPAGRAKEAERALEEACLERFGTLRLTGPKPVVRSDNGLLYQSRRFRAACRDYRVRQEFITPYTPEQNGIVERFFRSLKEECVWQHVFRDFAEARCEITAWIRWYKTERPHQALGYRTPPSAGLNNARRWLDVEGALEREPPTHRKSLDGVRGSSAKLAEW